VLAYQRATAGASATEALETFIGLWRQVVTSSGGASGCVVAGVAIDTNAGEPGLIDVVRGTFRSWIALLTEQLQAAGLPDERTTAIATATLAGLEGALILCRAEGNSGPLELVTGELLRLLPEDDSSSD
jgi:TetR/AcrR family transcriptional repressor of lmrAB and yxaGH operons